MYKSFADVLGKEAPDFAEDVERARYAQLYLANALVGTVGVPRAVRLIATLAASDLNDLLDDVSRGAGRSAMRVTRTLIEHQVNMHTVLASSDDAERYMAHLDQGPLLLEDAPEGFFLDEGARRSVEHLARKQARDARRLWDASVDKYGKSFERQWHPSNIRDRSDAAGRPDLYRLYKFGSAVAHGSSAGATGQYRRDNDDLATYASGRVPALVPLALAVGTEAYFALLSHMREHLGGDLPDMDTLIHAAGQTLFTVLRKHSPAIHRVSRAQSDRALNRSDRRTYLAFSRGGRFRLYVGDSNNPGRWNRGIERQRHAAYQQWVTPVVAAYIRQGRPFNEGGWAAIEIPDPEIEPDWMKVDIPDDVMPLIVRADDGTWITGDQVQEGIFVNVAVVHPGTDLTHLFELIETWPEQI